MLKKGRFVCYNNPINRIKAGFKIMKKLTALLCSIIFLTGFLITSPVQAKYSVSDLESSLKSAVKFMGNKPLKDVGTEASDVFITAISRAGFDFDYDAYLDELDLIVKEYKSTDNILQIQRSAITVTACKGNTQYFGGRDLLADATYYRGDDAPLGKNGVVDYIGALIALDTGDFKLPDNLTHNNRESMIRKILSMQDENGSFEDDISLTAASIIALSPYNNNVEYKIGDELRSCGSAIYNAVEYLSDKQNDDGDFYELKSTALVSLAMDAIGIDSDDKRFVKDGNAVIDGILTYQKSNGSFSNDFNETDLTATSYATAALVSHLRNINHKKPFFDFTSMDYITLGSTNAAVPTKKPTTLKPTTAPKVTLKPTKPASTPSVTLKPMPTPSPTPTVRPALVGPVQEIGPLSPTPPVFDAPSKDDAPVNIGQYIILIILCVLILVAISIIYMIKKKLYMFKDTEKLRNDIINFFKNE